MFIRVMIFPPIFTVFLDILIKKLPWSKIAKAIIVGYKTEERPCSWKAGWSKTKIAADVANSRSPIVVRACAIACIRHPGCAGNLTNGEFVGQARRSTYQLIGMSPNVGACPACQDKEILPVHAEVLLLSYEIQSYRVG